MAQIKHYIRAKVRWDQIPEQIVITYEEKILALSRTGLKGRAFKEQEHKIYNELFGEFGYTKSLN